MVRVLSVRTAQNSTCVQRSKQRGEDGKGGGGGGLFFFLKKGSDFPVCTHSMAQHGCHAVALTVEAGRIVASVKLCVQPAVDGFGLDSSVDGEWSCFGHTWSPPTAV